MWFELKVEDDNSGMTDTSAPDVRQCRRVDDTRAAVLMTTCGLRFVGNVRRRSCVGVLHLVQIAALGIC